MLQPIKFKTYFLEFQLHGLPESLVYPVEQEESERLQRVLEQSAKEHKFWHFLFFSTTKKQRVMVSLQDIQFVTCGWNVEQSFVMDIPSLPEIDDDDPEPSPSNPTIDIYFRDRPEPYHHLLVDPGPLEVIFQTESFEFKDEPFIAFLDGEGERSTSGLIKWCYSATIGKRKNETAPKCTD